MVELLAPAGSFDSAKAAVSAGADAVYMGGSRFGARAFAESVEEERTAEALDYVHFHGRKLYLTVNTLVKERELDELPDFLAPYLDRGLDGVILQDFGVWQRIRDCFPDLPVHISTQMTLTGSQGAGWMEKLGASRVVLARELSLEEIRAVRENISIEIEAFVHGAICYCYSGQCLMSSMIGGRSGNRGRCAQPCRLPYGLESADCKSVDYKSVNHKSVNHKSVSQENRFLLNLKDMCTVEYIPQLVEAGVNSMKIEGRMKSPVYTAGVVSVYRKYLDRCLEYGKEGFAVELRDMRILSELFDRGGFTDYLWRRNGREMMALAEKPRFRPVDQKVINAIESQYLSKELKRKVYGIVTLEKGKPATIALECDGIRFRLEGETVEAAKSRPLTAEAVEKQVKKTGNSDFCFEKLDVQVEEGCFLNIQALNELRRQGLERLKRELIGRSGGGTVYGACKYNGNDKSNSQENRKDAKDNGSYIINDITFPAITVLVPDFASAAWAIEEPGVDRVIVDEGQKDEPEQLRELAGLAHSHGKELLYRLPPVLRNREAKRLQNCRKLLTGSGLDGLVLRTADEAGLVCEAGWEIPVVLDHSFYTWNRQALIFLKKALGSRLFYTTLPLELNRRELADRGCEGSELVIYGHAPLMVTAGCVKKTGSACDHREELLYLTDRKKKRFPVKTLCKSCCNLIYNGEPLYLFDQMEEVTALKPASVRLEFTIETWKRQQKLTRMLQSVLRNTRQNMPQNALSGSFGKAKKTPGGARSDLPGSNLAIKREGLQGRDRASKDGLMDAACTRGHFRRGVD